MRSESCGKPGPGRREDVGREAERVVVEVVVVDVGGVAVRARVAARVVVRVAVADLLAVAELRVDPRCRAGGRVGAGAGVEPRVAVAGGVAVRHHAVVLDEGENAVLAAVEGLEAVEQVAVALEHVDVVLGRVAHLQVADHDAVGAVGADADVLHRADGAPSPDSTRPASIVTSSGAATELVDLQVAADARPRSGMNCRSSIGGRGRGIDVPAHGRSRRSGSGRSGSRTATCRTARRSGSCRW